MLGMNIWLRQQQTLYTKCISESVFGLLSLIVLFLAVEFFRCAKILCLMLIFFPPFPGKLLSSGQSQTRSVKTPVSHLGAVLGPPAARRLTDCSRSSASMSC